MRPEMPASKRSSLVSASSPPMLVGRLPPSPVTPAAYVSSLVTRIAPPITAHVTPFQLLVPAAPHTLDLSPVLHQLVRCDFPVAGIVLYQSHSPTRSSDVPGIAEGTALGTPTCSCLPGRSSRPVARPHSAKKAVAMHHVLASQVTQLAMLYPPLIFQFPRRRLCKLARASCTL